MICRLGLLKRSVNGTFFGNYFNKTYATAAAAASTTTTVPTKQSNTQPKIIKASVLLERYPVLHPEVDELEKEIIQALHSNEQENSLLSLDEVISLQKSKISGQEQKKEEIVKTYTPTSRLSEADEKDDRKSIHRKMDQFLYLIIKDQAGAWRLPESTLAEQESVRQVADEAINQLKTDSEKHPLITYTYSYCPSGHYTAQDHESMIFMYRCLYQTGRINYSQFEDYAWVSKGEMSEYLHESVTKITDIVAE